MAGIGFELRKLYRKEGIIHQLQAYAYSTMTTVGPMFLCLGLFIVQRYFMQQSNVSYLENELFTATIAYCFIFSIVVSSGLSLVVTRYIADLIYVKQFANIKNAYYGSMIILLPIAAIISATFLWTVEASLAYKACAYLYFLQLVVIWIQNVFMSALKNYKRIFFSFLIASVVSVTISFLLFTFTALSPIICALLSMNIGFTLILVLNAIHFEKFFPIPTNNDFFAFLAYVKKYPILIFNGLFVYSGVYIHTFIYWYLSDAYTIISGRFHLMGFYDVPVFYAYLSVIPSLILFVVIIETDFFEKFTNYYKNITTGGTYESIQMARKKMRKVLLQRIAFLSEIQLLFSTIAIAVGLIVFPKIGFTMQQLDIYIILCFGYFFFILLFILLHILMYFDDQKGIFILGGSFIVTNGILTYITMNLEYDGIGMFISSFVFVCLVLSRILYLIQQIDYYTFCPQPIATMVTQKKSLLSKKSGVITATFLSVFLLAACTDEATELNETVLGSPTAQIGVSTTDFFEIDDKRLYERDDDASIKTFYVTIFPNKDNPTLDWYALNHITERYNEDSFNIIVAEGLPDGKGPVTGMFGASETTANAKIRLRGNSARGESQKSYKIELKDSAGTWHDQTVINLNKHLADGVRIRNKLSFDLMEPIPYITSLRTQFVQLYIKDLTSGDSTYQNYGLYTHVEQPNKRFLKSHQLDKHGYLYKVTFFEFMQHPQLKLTTDPTYSVEEFEQILEIKGREEHDKLLHMLADVNNLELDINEVVEKHFVEDNLLTWLAINILMDNTDTDANNFYLYSPLNHDKWLLLPWDYDDAWNNGRQFNRFNTAFSGLSIYWGSTLFNRYFRIESNVEKLTEKIQYLYEHYINEQTVENQLSKYSADLLTIINRQPDIEHLRIKLEDYDDNLQQIISTPKHAIERYLADLQKPKPFYQGHIGYKDGNTHTFYWEPSFDLQFNPLYYSAKLTKSIDQSGVIAEVVKTRETKLVVENLPAGTYYLHVRVEDSEGNVFTSYDKLKDEESGLYYFGVTEVVAE
jgi:polysaccharide biosynthesis protein PelG